jgi:SP family sugar:H+ symporter-like MFS transporter
MAKFSVPKFNVKKLALSPWVHYDQFNPSSEQANGARKSLTNLDYSPLRRITFPSVILGVVVSMGGFL